MRDNMLDLARTAGRHYIGLLCLIAAASVSACDNDVVTTAATPEPTDMPVAQSTPTHTSQEAPAADGTGVDGTPPDLNGSILVSRDGDLHLLEGRSERQLTESGDYWTGVLTKDGDVIALRLLDDGGSSLVRLAVGEGTYTNVATLNWQPAELALPHGELLVSPDEKHVLVGNLIVALEAGRQAELPPSCCASWAPDGSLVAFLTFAGDPQKEDDGSVPLYDLWVVAATGDAAPRRLAVGLMHWFGLFGRVDEQPLWWKDGADLLVLSGKAATRTDRRIGGAGLFMPVNNRLISVDVETGTARQLASALDLHGQMNGEFEGLADELAISAPSTPRDGGRPAFLVMDYRRTFVVNTLDRDGQLERLLTKEIPDGRMVGLSAPVWAPDGRRLAYFGWYGLKRKPFVEVLDIATGRVERVWESTVYRKPGHWDVSPDGEWVWVPVRDFDPVDGSVKRTLSFLASVERPGHVETIPGEVLDWCCFGGGN